MEVSVEKISPAGEPTRPLPSGGTVFNLHGPNSRVNIGSTDYSTNISSKDVQNVFVDIRRAIKDNIPSEETQQALLQMVDELEESQGSASFVEKYKEFMASAADHIGVLGPFVPALSQLLGG